MIEFDFRTSLTHAIQTALPVILENDIKFGRIPDDIPTLISVMNVLSLAKPINRGYMEMTMKKIADSNVRFDERQAKQVIDIISRLKYVSNLKKILINKAYTPLCKKTDNMNLPETLQILSTMYTTQAK